MKLLVIAALASTLGLGIASHASAAQRRLANTGQRNTEAVPTKAMTLATVHVPRTVKADDRAVASIVPPDQINEVAEERVPAAGHARVDVLKGNDYVRLWINKAGNSYLIHLPTATS